MTAHNLLVEGGIGLTVFFLVSHDPFHGDFVSPGVSRNREETVFHSNACRFVKVLRSVQNVCLGIIFTQVISTESAERLRMLWIDDHGVGDERSRLNLAAKQASMLTLCNIVNLTDRLLLSEATSTHSS